MLHIKKAQWTSLRGSGISAPSRLAALFLVGAFDKD